MAGASDPAPDAGASTAESTGHDGTSNGTGAGTAGFERIQLPEPSSWAGGPRLFPGNVIAGYNADYEKHTAESWAAYVLQKSSAFDRCSTALAFSGASPNGH